MPRSFTDPDTTFVLVQSETPPSVDVYAIGEPTGEVTCAECEQTARNIDDIPHRQDCPQRFVRSQWWARSFCDGE